MSRVTTLGFGLILILLGCQQAQSQELKRKGRLGIRLTWMDDATAKEKGLNHAYGMLVSEVVPDGTADGAGVKAGDLVFEVNGLEAHGWELFSDPKLDLRAGDAVTFTVERAGKNKTLKGKVVGLPYETSDQWDVIYGSVPFRSGRLRTIVTKPKGEGPFPTILFIPGFTCSSVDNMNPIHPYRQLIDQLSGMGYAVYRVEKPGLGDCEGTQPCTEIDFPTEVEAFETGFKDMLTKPYVDQSKTYIFGHSLGGVVAPFIGAKHDLTGIIVYGTTHEPWHEYLLQMVRFQNPRFGSDYAEVEAEMDLYWKLFDGLSRQNKSPQEMVKENPAYGPLMESALAWDGGENFIGRTYRFNNSIDDLNNTEAWTKTNEYVLAMYAESDFEAIDPRATKNIVRIVNTKNPGKATYHFVEGTDHSMIKTGDMEATLKVRQSSDYQKLFATNFNKDIAKAIDKWIREKTW